MVLYGHCYPLTGHTPEPLHQFGLNLGHIAVDIFFVTSGYLVTGSLVSRKNIIHFFLARFLRIFPGLLIALLFCVFIIGISYSNLTGIDYLSHPRTYSFIFTNLNLLSNKLQWDLPGVFLNNPYKVAVNGSLWTLPWEINMYIILFTIGIMLYMKPSLANPSKIWIPLVMIYIISTLLFFLSYYNNPNDFSHKLRFLSTFFAGASLYIFRHYIMISHRIFFIILFMLIYFSNTIQIFFSLYHILIAYLVLYFAFFPYKKLHQFNQLGDYSYGVYIYAFPVQQAVSNSFPGIAPNRMFLLSSIITLCCAIISWHFIESPLLKLKSRYIWFEQNIFQHFSKS